MVTAFAVSFVAWPLTIFAACAASMNPALLQKAAWVKGTVSHTELGVQMHIVGGLNGRVDTLDCTKLVGQSQMCSLAAEGTLFEELSPGLYQRVVDWSDSRSCMSVEVLNAATARAHLGLTMNETVFTGEACRSCGATAMASVTFAIMGAITQIPQMTTDLQRSTTFGDVNCQATMGAVTSFFGTYSTLASLATFSQSCYRNFPAKMVSQEGLELDYEWSLGLGYYCIVVATVLKLWDAFSHVFVPTPKARHYPPEKGISLETYMRRGFDEEKNEDESSEASEDSDGDGPSDSME